MRAIAEVEFASPFDLGELLVASSVKFLLAQASETDRVFITHDHRLRAIDAESPLWGNSPEDLERLQAEVLILIKAYDDTFSQTVLARHSYLHDEVVCFDED